MKPTSDQPTERQPVKRIDVARALKLRLRGNTCEEIGLVFGVTRQAVSQALTKFEPFLNNAEPGVLTAYAEERSNIFTAVESRLIASLVDEQAIQKASLRDRTIAFGTVYDKGRLERGQSTNNIGILGKLVMQAEERLGTTTGSGSSKKSEPKDVTPQQISVSTVESRPDSADDEDDGNA